MRDEISDEIDSQDKVNDLDMAALDKIIKEHTDIIHLGAPRPLVD